MWHRFISSVSAFWLCSCAATSVPDEPSTAADNAGPKNAAADQHPTHPSDAAETEPEPTSAHRAGEPSAAPGWHDLELSDSPAALVWAPDPRGLRLPLVVIAHGAGGGPRWHCEFWQQVFEDSAYLLCLRGRPLGDGGHYFPEHHTLGRMVAASVAAFDAHFAESVDPELGVYIGYSQGATMGAWVLPQVADRFGRALFIEGGYGEWNVKRALEFRDAGGIAVFFACGTRSCNSKAKSAVRWFERAGVAASMGHANGEGHTPAGRVGLVAVEGLSFLLSAGDSESGAIQP